jgi:hypothetical protein
MHLLLAAITANVQWQHGPSRVISHALAFAGCAATGSIIACIYGHIQ